MKVFAETATTPQQVQTRFAHLRHVHGTAIWEIAEAAESLTELSEEETVTPASTTFDVTPLKSSLDWVRRFFEIKPQLTQLSNLKLPANTESIHLDEPLSNRYVAGEYLGFQHPPETRWIQNLRHPSYQLRQPIPIVIERSGGLVTANYDDLRLEAKGDDVNDVLSDLCRKIIACYDEVQERADRKGTAHSPEHAFLKQIIVETQPRVWEEVKQLYREKLKLFPFVEKGFINVSAPDYAEVIIILSDDASDRIQQLAEIDLEINQKYRPLFLYVNYALSDDFLELNDFVRFY